MIKELYIYVVAVACLLLFVQCANPAEPSDDVKVSKQQEELQSSLTKRINTVDLTTTGLTQRINTVQETTTGLTQRINTVQETTTGLTQRIDDLAESTVNALRNCQKALSYLLGDDALQITRDDALIATDRLSTLMGNIQDALGPVVPETVTVRPGDSRSVGTLGSAQEGE